MTPLADRRLRRGRGGSLIVKSLVIFVVGLAARAGRADGRAQAARPLPEPLRPQPRRPVRRCCSRSPTSSSCSPRSSSARAPSIGWLFALAPVISIIAAVADARDHPVRQRRRHLRHDGRPLRDRRLDRPALRLRLRLDRLLRPAARRLGLGLEVLASSARCAPPRS